MNVAVIGIGRIGLPVAAKIASRGHHVFGCDINAERVALVNRGENPIPDEAGLAELIKQVVASGNLTATSDTVGAVAQCETVLFAVAVRCRPFGARGSQFAVCGGGIGGDGDEAWHAVHLRYDVADWHDAPRVGTAA